MSAIYRSDIHMSQNTRLQNN